MKKKFVTKANLIKLWKIMKLINLIDSLNLLCYLKIIEPK